jgi:hypothetical protein
LNQAGLGSANRQGIAKSLVSSAICGRPFSSLRVPTTAHDFAFAIARACLCNDSVKSHFECVLRGFYPRDEI